MANSPKIQNVISNLNNVHAVHNVRYNQERKTFDFFYNEEIQRKSFSVPNAECYVYESAIHGDFANSKYKTGEYLQSLFMQLDLNVEGKTEIS